MDAETYNPLEDMSSTERDLLKAAAAKENRTSTEFIEATLKRRLWVDRPITAPIPRPLLGKRRAATV